MFFIHKNPFDREVYVDLDYSYIPKKFTNALSLVRCLRDLFTPYNKNSEIIEVSLIQLKDTEVIRISFNIPCEVKEGFGISISFLKKEEFTFRFEERNDGIHLDYTINQYKSVF